MRYGEVPGREHAFTQATRYIAGRHGHVNVSASLKRNELVVARAQLAVLWGGFESSAVGRADLAHGGVPLRLTSCLPADSQTGWVRARAHARNMRALNER
jgi:hypothetical protein